MTRSKVEGSRRSEDVGAQRQAWEEESARFERRLVMWAFGWPSFWTLLAIGVAVFP